MTDISYPTGAIAAAAAQRLVRAAHDSAERLGLTVAVAAVDTGGHLVAFERADRVPFLAGDVAINKAWTAASFGRPTHVWNDYIADPQVAPLSTLPRMTAVGGGYPS